MKEKFNFKYIHELLTNSSIEAGLYIIATPIGNLSDITIRALNILSLSKMVYCEDTRVSKKLTTKYGINCVLKPFHKFNSKSLIPEIIKKLENKLETWHYENLDETSRIAKQIKKKLI